MPEDLHLETDAGPAHEDEVPAEQRVMPIKSSRGTTDMVDAAQELIEQSRRRRDGGVAIPAPTGELSLAHGTCQDSRVEIPHAPPALGMTLWGYEHPRLDSPPPSHRITLGIF
jgi:hypothetical protein